MNKNNKFCIYCGLEHEGKERICPNCNKKLNPKHADFEAFVKKTSKEKIKDEAVGKAYSLVKKWIVSRLYGVIVTVAAVFTVTSVVTTVAAVSPKEEDVPINEFPEISNYEIIKFGTYPQTELLLDGSDAAYALLEVAESRHLKYELLNQTEYDNLQNANYDANNDAVVEINGKTVKIRRLTRNTAEWHTFTPTSYPYEIDYLDHWHYFKYEPIRWRVLSSDKKEYLLMSNLIIDNYRSEFNGGGYDWEHSTIRERLNSEFINMAFTSEEAARILETELDNPDVEDGLMIGVGGNPTVDKVFLPTIFDIFDQGYDDVNEDRTEKIDIQLHYSTYAHARGVFGGEHGRMSERGGSEFGNWWTRSMWPDLDWTDRHHLMSITDDAKSGAGILDTGVAPFIRIKK